MASSICSVTPIQPIDATDPLLGDEPTETLLQSGEEEANQEEDPLEDAEGEDDDEESVGLAFLRFHGTTYTYLWTAS